jgi:DNA-binding IclR family transcriptional regulator
VGIYVSTPTSGAQAIRRAIEVVRTVAQIQRSGASLSRIARAAGLSSSTAFRILRSLTEERLLRYDEAERCYHVGPLAFELGLAALTEARLQTSWRETIEAIARETRLTTYLMARSGNEAVCLLCAQGSTALRAIPMEVGQRLPLGIGAGSLAMLAALDDAEVDQVIDSQGARRDPFPGGRIKPEQIRKRVELTRQRGFSISSGTVALGVTGVGVVVPPRYGMTQLAISVSAVADGINEAEARKTAALIARAIGEHADPHIS